MSNGCFTERAERVYKHEKKRKNKSTVVTDQSKNREWKCKTARTNRGIQGQTFVSYARPCQILFCQTAPLLSSVTQQQLVMECRWEGSVSTAIPPPSASDVMGQHNKQGGITFRADTVMGGSSSNLFTGTDTKSLQYQKFTRTSSWRCMLLHKDDIYHDVFR